MSNVNPSAHGNYSQGGFWGRASKRKTKWIQKGGNRGSASASGPVAGIVYSIAGGVILVITFVIGYLAHGYGLF